MRNLGVSGVLALLVGLSWLDGESNAPPSLVPADGGPPARTATLPPASPWPLSPSGDASPAACQTGCAVGNHPITPLSPAEYDECLERYARGGEEEREAALETLLFHGPTARRFADTVGLGPLDSAQASRLRRELSRSHARLWLRLVDEGGVVRAAVEGARFPIGKKEHVHVTSTDDLQPPEVSGTIHRTGLHHLWTRI